MFQKISLRDKVGEILCKFGDNKKIFVLDSDLAKSTTSIKFKEKYPDRFIECGISEQSAVSIATGLAIEGKIPFYVNFAILATGTAWTQLRQGCYSNSNIKIIGTHPGLDDGPDGASHHANEDIALTRVIPNLKILIPSNEKELEESINLAINSYGPVYIRVARDLTPINNKFTNKSSTFGKSQVIKDDGNDIAIIYEGTATLAAWETYEYLNSNGYRGKLINAFSLKPFDDALIAKLIEKTKLLVTIENHSIIGGLGSIISDELCKYNKHPRLIKIGINDVFTESGATKDLKEKYGLDPVRISEDCIKILSEINNND